MSYKIKNFIKTIFFLLFRILGFFKGSHHGSSRINIIGDVRSESGLGAITRQVISSLGDRADFQIVDLPMSIKSRQNGFVPSHFRFVERPRSGINIFIGNPDMLIRALLKFGPTPFLRGYCIGLWFWELETPPYGWKLANKVMNEIWVQSHFVKDAFNDFKNNVFVMPFTLESICPSNASKESLGLPGDKFIFLLLSIFYHMEHGKILELSLMLL